MKKFILIIFVILTLNISTHAGWFTHDNQQQQIDNLQDQLDQQTHANSQLHIVIIILSTGVVIALVVGAAVGSKARKAAKEVEN